MRRPINGTPAPSAPLMSFVVQCDADLCTVQVASGPHVTQLVLGLDDAEGVANLILAKVREARANASPIEIVGNIPGLKS